MPQNLTAKSLAYMHECMQDAAHDTEHVMRVLYMALEIAAAEGEANLAILAPACLLHDIGRDAQFQNPEVDHAAVGADMACAFLIKEGMPEADARAVQACIFTHRYRKSRPPQSLEAKILFDADKLDVTGAIGIARTILYKGVVNQPLYSLSPAGQVLDGVHDTQKSFLQEYQYKLKDIYSRFYTATAAAIARRRRHVAALYYEELLREAREGRQAGLARLAALLENAD